MLLSLMLVLGALPVRAETIRGQAGTLSPGTPPPAGGVKANDLDTTIPLNLNNMQIDQLVKFLMDTTGKPIIKQKDVQAQITVMSPTPVTKGQALELIYRALQMQGIFVIDTGPNLQIVTAEQVKNMPLLSIPADQDIQSLPDSPQLAQRIYRLRNISAENLQKHLEKLVSKEAMTVDNASNTLILTDQIERLKRYDQVVRSLDMVNQADRVTEIIQLVHADAMELAELIGQVLIEGSSPGGRGGQGSHQGGMPPHMQQGGGGRSPSARPVAVTAGEVTIVPDPRMNWLIISAPSWRQEEIRALVTRFDILREVDVQSRMLPVQFMEVNSLAQVVQQLFVDQSRNRAERDQVRVVPSDDGASLVVMSSSANFRLIQDLARQLDIEDASKRETRTYAINNLEAKDLAEQLVSLYDSESNSRNRNPFYGGWGYGQNSREVKPSFVSSPRNNSLMVMARPRDFEFIEKMIKELDVPIDPTQYEPRIYQIKNTDANEVLKVLKAIFDQEGGRRSQSFWEMIYGSSSRNDVDSLQAQFGKIRFVVDNVTNTIVALCSNKANYDIIDSVIARLDRLDEESTQLMIYDLKYADALEIANHLNNLFSDGPVGRQGEGGGSGGGGSQNQPREGSNTSASEMKEYFADSRREVVYPWQSAGRERQRQQETERPINTMIGSVRVVPDIATNKIMIAAPPIYFGSIKMVLEQMDRPQPQVHISTRIIEIVRTRDERRGIRWTPDRTLIDQAELDGAILALGQLGYVDAYGSGNPFDVENPTAGWSTTTRSGNTILGGSINMNLLIQLLVKNTQSRVIFEPKLTVNNNQIGHFRVVSAFPFIQDSQTTDRGGITIGYDYREVGIIVYLRPHINPDGHIVLKAAVENSKVREGEVFNGQLIRDIQRLETEAAVRSGETIVVGGIIVEDQSLIRRGIPVLHRIPVVNWLLGKKDDSNFQRELVFFLTPEVVNPEDGQRLLLERQRDRLEQMDPFTPSEIFGPHDDQAKGVGLMPDSTTSPAGVID